MFNDVSLIMIAAAAIVIFVFGIGATVRFFGWRKNKKDASA